MLWDPSAATTKPSVPLTNDWGVVDKLNGGEHDEVVPPKATPVTATEVQLMRIELMLTKGQFAMDALVAETEMSQVSFSTPRGTNQEVEVDTVAAPSGFVEVREIEPDEALKSEIRFIKKGATPGIRLGRLAPVRDASATKLYHRSMAIKRLMAVLRSANCERNDRGVRSDLIKRVVG